PTQLRAMRCFIRVLPVPNPALADSWQQLDRCAGAPVATFAIGSLWTGGYSGGRTAMQVQLMPAFELGSRAGRFTSFSQGSTCPMNRCNSIPALPHLRCFLAVAIALGGAMNCQAQPVPVDPVQGLRRTLQAPAQDLQARDWAVK